MIGKFLKKTKFDVEKIGLESGSLTHYLKKLLKEGYKVVGMESRKMNAILKTTVSKTDRNDARGIAEALKAGYYQEIVHRSEVAIEIRTLLHSRNTLN